MKTNNWYTKTASDIKPLIQRVKRLDFDIARTKHAIGKRIIKVELKFKKPAYGNKTIENLAKDVSTTKNDLWDCMRFAKKFDDVKQFEGISWHKITHDYLPEKRRKITHADNKVPKIKNKKPIGIGFGQR